MATCKTGKRIYQTEALAEDALIDSHGKYHYTTTGPVAVYHCDECGFYHFTSKGPMNKRLNELIASGKIHRQREAAQWEKRLRK